MPINTAAELSRKERELLERQQEIVRRREAQEELVVLQQQAQAYINKHVAHLQSINALNNKINLSRLSKYKVFKQQQSAFAVR